MSASIFQPEITTLEAQLAALQAQIAAVQEQRVALNKAEAVAENIVQAVRGGVEEFQQITGISDDAIARVKQAVLDIFGGNPDNGNDDGNGGLPLEPAPQPSDDGGSEVAIAVELEQDSSADQETVAIAVETQQATALDKLKAKLNRAYPWSVEQMPMEQSSSAVVAIAVNPEPLTGQSCEWASPWASPLASPLATPLCCQMEDAPTEAFQGRFKYLDDDVITVTEVSPEVPQPELQSEPEQLATDFQKEVQARGIQTIYSSDGTPKFDLIWTRLSDRVATYSSPENPYNWEGGFVTYLGFATKEVAEAWQQHLLKIGAATKCIIRKVNRLKVDTPKGVRIRWEMKCHGLTECQMQNILTSDLTQPPVCNLPEPEVLAALAKFHTGDRVKVVKAWANGDTRDMGRLGTVNRLIVRDGLVAVDLDDCSVQRDYTPDTIAHLEIQDLVPVVVDDSAEVRDISTTDWQAEAKEVGVRIDYSAPGHYIAYHKYRKLGEVVEKHDADSPYYVNRNQRTMLNVGNGDGLKYSDPYEAAIGLAKFLKVIVEPEVAKADLNSSYNEPFPAPQALQTWREIEIEQQKQINVAPTEQQIEANDWVELLVNGDRYQVGEVDAEGVHLNTNDGTMLVQPNEIQLLMKIPATWQPFQAPTNWQPF